MKKLLLLSAMLLIAGGIWAQGGIKFSEGNWDALLAKAKAQNALIFMDAYATWCGPCKMMSNQVFTDGEVGNYYNTHFINVKMDMEKGEGIDLAKKYEVQAYPTLLFIDGDGQLVHRMVGFQGTEEFIELGKTASDPAKRLGGLAQRYADGDRDPEFLHSYAMILYNAMATGYQEVGEAYLATQNDWNTPENMEFIYYMVDNVDSRLFQYMIDNKAAFEEMFGEEAITGRIQELIYQKAFADGRNGEEAVKEVEAMLAKNFPQDAPRLTASFKMNYYNMQGDVENYARAAVEYFNQYTSEDPNELNNVAWTFYENIQDKELLKKALGWAQRSVELDEQYYNSDTVAALYYKLGDKKKGKKAAQKAIEIAKKNGEDYSGTEQMMQQWSK